MLLSMRRLLRIAASLALISSGIFGFSTAAQAHDDVVETSPVSGSVAEAGAFDVTVTFSEELMNIGAGTGLEIAVTGPDGTVWSNSCVSVDGASMSTTVDLSETGTYDVAWRAVAVDGHPTEGTFSFELENSTGYESGGMVEMTPECQARTTLGGAPSATPIDDGGAEDIGAYDSSAWIGLGIGIIFIAIGSVAGALKIRRDQRKVAEKTQNR